MQLKELVKAIRTLETVQYEKTDISFSYKLMKFMKAAKDDVAFYDRTANEIINKYALRDNDGKVVSQGNNIQLDLSKKEEMEKEIEKLNTTEIEFPNIKFNIVDFQGLKLSVFDLMNLENFIIEEE